MDAYTLLKNEILQIHQELLHIKSRAASLSAMSDPFFEEWGNVCRETFQHITEDVVRIAVVGTVKSGKSTLINSMFKGDYLKRGAGVVTSIVTRIRYGQSLKALLYFKSWDEVADDMNRALILFPSPSRSDSERFDIRRIQDRQKLEHAMGELKTEQFVANDTRDANSILLSSYLKGYERIKDIVSPDGKVSVFAGKNFQRHKEFVGNDSLAVYLKDVLLEIGGSTLGGEHIEIADCQGSDSPNPLHLAMIQDYLLLTHMIVYVISSRTGLRQADIKFLSIIKKMGIIDNIVFVVNCDFNEHETLDDLNRLLDKIKEDLSLIKPDPEIYALSGLYNLFRHCAGNLSEKDQFRFDQWEKESDFCEFSDQQTLQLESSLVKKITEDRYSLLLRNHLERFAVLASAMEHWGAVSQKVLREDSAQAVSMIEKISYHQNAMIPIRDMIRTTLEGAAGKITQDIKSDIDRFFDAGYGEILKDVGEWIQRYSISHEKYFQHLESSGFSGTLYLVFQEFKQALDGFMTEAVNPKLVNFVRAREEMVGRCFETVCRPYDAIIKDALEQYNDAVEALGISRMPVKLQKTETPDFDSIKIVNRLAISPATATVNYRAKVRTEAMMRLGAYRLVNYFKRLLKKPFSSHQEEEYLALKDALRQLKRETRMAVAAHFNDYKENLKFQYISKLVDAVGKSYQEQLLSRFNNYGSSLLQMQQMVDEKRITRQEACELVEAVTVSSRQVLERISDARKQLDSPKKTSDILMTDDSKYIV
ncbi:MAG: dynamin family protein [Desulfobacterales bacterium]|nr:dynamin family protein [Desulfobacterales bacterium]MDD4071813.1 dynamin family protein [Desulfobacterales bacterium]MDD4393389.1 dynamin family protein [Desulfobacterales bacterium]